MRYKPGINAQTDMNIQRGDSSNKIVEILLSSYSFPQVSQAFPYEKLEVENPDVVSLNTHIIEKETSWEK